MSLLTGEKQDGLSPWLRLLRAPNLLTVPGDTLVGFLLAAARMNEQPRMLYALLVSAASLCLYGFGLVLNDLVDIECDTRERPERPLPAGEITVHQARMGAIALGLSGLNLALFAGRVPLLVAAALGGVIIAYNGALKHIPVAGVASMGLCRGLSLLLGASASNPAIFSSSLRTYPLVWLAVATLVVYVAGFSEIARHEMSPTSKMRIRRFAPFAVLLLCLPLLLSVSYYLRMAQGMLPVGYVFLMVVVIVRAWLLGGLLFKLLPVPEVVGGHIRNLLLLQASLCLLGGARGVGIALVLVLLSTLFKGISRRFYSS